MRSPVHILEDAIERAKHAPGCQYDRRPPERAVCDCGWGLARPAVVLVWAALRGGTPVKADAIDRALKAAARWSYHPIGCAYNHPEATIAHCECGLGSIVAEIEILLASRGVKLYEEIS